MEDENFWAYQAHGLVIYATPDNLRSFRVPNALQPQVKVSDRFHLKPLLRSTTFCDAGYVLALADGGVRLIEVSKDLPALEVTVPDLPTDAASAVGKRTIATRSYSGRIGGGEGKKVRLRQYARKVDAAVRAILAGRQEPLILALVEALDAIYRWSTAIRTCWSRGCAVILSAKARPSWRTRRAPCSTRSTGRRSPIGTRSIASV